MLTIQKVHQRLVAGLAVVAAVGLAGRVQAQELTIGTIGSASDAPFFIADEVINILIKYSFIKDAAVHRAIISQAVDPDGQLNMPSLQMAWQFFKDTKEIDGSVKVDDVVDLSYVQAASKVLGPYVKKTTTQ